MTNISSENVWYQVKYQQKENEIPCPRSGHTAVFFRNSLLFVFGGLTDQDALNDMHVYNLHTNTWSSVVYNDKWEVPSKRASHAMVCVENLCKFYLFGGTSAQLTQLAKNDLWEFDIETSAWSLVKVSGKPPSERYGHTMNIYKNYLLIFGGARASTTPKPDYPSELYQYNMLTATFSVLQTTGPAPEGRFKHQAIVIKDDLFIIGGTTNMIRFGNISKLDLLKKTWTTIVVQKSGIKEKEASLFKGRFGHALYADSQNIYIYGGYDEKTCSDMIKLDVANKQFKKHHSRGVKPEGRDFFAFDSLDNLLVIFGGRENSTRLNDMHIFKKYHQSFSYKECTLRNEMATLLYSPAADNFADVEIEFKDPQTKESQLIFAHMCILKNRCLILFNSIRNTANGKRIDLACNPKFGMSLIHYIYTMELKVNSFEYEELLQFCLFVSNFDVKNLLSRALYFLIHRTPKNVKDNEKLVERLGKHLQILKTEKNPRLEANCAILEKVFRLLNHVRAMYNFDKMTTAARKETISELSTLYQTYFDFSEEKEVQGYYEDFAALRNDKQTADFTIELQDQQRFIAHVPILIARSSYFESMISVDFRESNQNAVKFIEITDGAVMEKLLDYCYTGYYDLRKSDISPEAALKLLQSAKYLDLKSSSFTILMESLVMEQMNAENTLSILMMADQMNFESLKAKAIHYICSNIKQITKEKSDFLLKLDKRTLVDIMTELATYTQD